MESSGNKIEITIPGVPHPQGRPRFARIGRSVHAYEVEADKEWKARVATEARIVWNKPPLDCPLVMNITFFMPIPVAMKRTGRRIAGASHVKRPDLSNLLKGVEDALNGIVYRDDSLLHQIWMHKCYSDNPRTWIEIVQDQDNAVIPKEEL